MEKTALNDAKFVMLVKQLDPDHPDFAARVVSLTQQRAKRSALIEGLVDAYSSSLAKGDVYDVIGHNSAKGDLLDTYFWEAIERFVVDNY